MFTVMDNRKRPRLELLNTNNSTSNMQGVASTTTSVGTATLATIGGQSFILSNNGNATLPANIFLSLCDDNSDESEEYILDHSMVTQIKQEQTVATQTTNNSQGQQQQPPTLVTTVPQYRFVNQATSKNLNSTPLHSPSIVNSNQLATNSSLISNSVHLPPGCEIYVIKEVIDSPKEIPDSCITSSSKAPLSGQTTIKLEPLSPLSVLRSNPQNLNTNSPNTITHNTPSAVTTSTSITSTRSVDDTASKRSLILEAYKKRDDKRRATHNEVERRRRDKINSWIFKLKEMLPTEVTPSGLNNSVKTTSQQCSSTTTTRLLLPQQGTTGNPSARTPPSDSKSQILIKACEYIKSMQEEIKSLRECLTENENLRLSNQRLQNEIQSLRAKQQQQKLHNNNNNNLFLPQTTTYTTNNNNNNNNSSSHNASDNPDDCEITLNSLNTTYANVQLFAPSTNSNTNHPHLAGLVRLTTTTTANTNTSAPSVNVVNATYAKRELIITDYVD